MVVDTVSGEQWNASSPRFDRVTVRHEPSTATLSPDVQDSSRRVSTVNRPPEKPVTLPRSSISPVNNLALRQEIGA